MKTLLRIIKMFDFKNLLLCAVLLMTGAVIAQVLPETPGGGGPPASPTLKTLIAGNDNLSITNPNGGSVNVLSNDTADSVAITPLDLAPGSDSLGVALTNTAGLTGVTLEGSTGLLSVSGSPAAGTYVISYQICQLLFAPAGCATGTVNLTVTATTIIAGADSATLLPSATQISILSNDFLGPAIPATTSTVTVTIMSNGGLPGLSFDSVSGKLNVPARSAGTYTPSYKICQTASPTNCSDPATVTITALAVPTAVADTASLPLAGGLVNVLANDTYGTTTATVAAVLPVFTVDPPVVGFSFNSSGQLVVPALAAGSYTLTYKICTPAFPTPTNCSAAVNVTLTIAAASTLTAVADTGLTMAAGTTGTFNILANDTVTTNGTSAAATTTTVTIKVITPATAYPGFSINASGQLIVATTVASGSYPLTYKICQLSNPNNCSGEVSSAVTVTSLVSTLAATADPSLAMVAGTTGAFNVLANDTVTTSGTSAAATSTTVTPSISVPVTGFSFNSSGQLAVATTVAAGSYPITYKICQVGNLTNCSGEVIAAVVVSAAPATLVATADSSSFVAGSGGTMSILANDTSNAAAATTTNVAVTITSVLPTGITLNASGQLAIATTVTAGSYAVSYKICQVGNLNNCSNTVSANVIVTAASVAGGAGLVLAVDAITMPVTGGSLNVLANDRFNTAVIPPSSVTLTLTSDGGAAGATLSPAGDLFVPTGLQQRIYLITYKVCLVSAPTNCATTTASINISAAVTTAARVIPSVTGAQSTNTNVITTTSGAGGGAPVSFSTGSSSGGSTAAGSGSINDPLTFTGARVSFGESITGFATVRLYASQDIPKFVAQLNFNGAGTLSANWVVIRPGDAPPNDVDLFPEGSLSAQQKLQRNRNYPVIDRATGYASGGSYLLAGPDPSKLPKSIPGIYRILLRLDGFGTFAMPALTYIVQSGNPPAPRVTTLAAAPVIVSAPQVSVVSIATTSPSAGTQLTANGIGTVVNLAWNWGASQSSTAVTSWHYEIYFENERIIRMASSSLKTDIRNFRIMLPSNFFAGKNLRWVVYGRDKDRQVIARSADMFFSTVAANP
jgi:hypothetical protein